MIGLDTNVLVRYIMQDDAKQAAKASALIESLTSIQPGFVPLIATVELVWVLGACFDLSKDQIAQALEGLLRSKQLVLDQSELVAKALRLFSSSSADFADCLISSTATAAGCSKTLTFDVGAAKAAGMKLL